MPHRAVVLCSAVLLLVAAPADAVVGGERAARGAHPAVVNLSGCTGTLIAPDRVLTAAHCVGILSEMRSLLGRRVARVSWHPRYLESTGAPGYVHGAERGDLALLGLDRPVRGVDPLPLLGSGDAAAVAPGRRVRVLGYGASRWRGLDLGRLRVGTATVEPRGRCGRRWSALGGQWARAWEAATMLCVRDPDGRPPYLSLCHGDSGGPVLARARGRWHVAGVNSWGGRRCGLSGDPSVSTRTLGDPFLARPEPVWAPAALPGTPRIEGEPRVGAALTCTLPGWTGTPDRVEYRWMINRRGGDVRTPDPVYVVQPADRGRAVACLAVAFNEGGKATTPAAPRVIVG